MSFTLPDRFETERLILRRYQAGDGPLYYAAGQKNRAHLQRYEAGNVILSPKNEAEAEAVVLDLSDEWDQRRAFFLGTFAKAGGEFVGQVYVGVVNWETPEFEVGYIVDQDHEGQGYVTEAVRAVVKLIFECLDAHRVRLQCDDTNLRSKRVAERCGFLREGHLRENHRYPDGSFSGTYLYGLLREDYELG